MRGRGLHKTAFIALTLFFSSLPLTLIFPQAKPTLAQKARAIIEKNCLACHGALAMSGLDLRQRETALKGGTRGPAIVPGNAQGSLFYQTVAHLGELKMPQGQDRLPEGDLETLREWIEAGAPWDASTIEKTSVPSWWSFSSPQRPPVPVVKTKSWVRNPVDAFILRSLEEKGLKPAPPADKRTLVRRAYFDLIGLPPTPEEVKSFLESTSPDAYEKLVEKLLASSHYGERWGRHWLDAVRYADSSGYETDFYYSTAWRYRDYVIKSFNDDKPYDRFLQEQIAGDELWPDDLELDGNYKIASEKLEHLEARIGTGLYNLGPQVHESNMDGRKLVHETLTDAVDTTGAALMGLTLGCARCHNHKFDPLSQRDYYGFQAIFASSQEMRIPLDNRMSLTDIKQHYPRVIAVEEARIAYRLFEKKVQRRVVEPLKAQFPPEVVKAYEVPEEERTQKEQELAAPLIEAANKIKVEAQFTPQEREEQKKLYAGLAEAVLAVPRNPSHGIPFDGLLEMPTAAVLGHREPELVPEVYVLTRGDLGHPAEKVRPALPAVLSDGTGFEEASSGSSVPQSRKKLALWMTRPDHPLTTRVMVNRIWQWHFGRGIVDTPNDFGRQGQPPTHPELLNWLAKEFVARGWSIKSMHRLLMLSSTYQMTSQYDDVKSARIDPDNRYQWRMNRRRLEAEVLWDAIHAVAGTLNPKMGGRPVAPPLTTDELTALGTDWHWPVSADPSEHNRRGVYVLVRRNFAFPMFDAFDRPDNSVSCPKRDVTTVAPQALWSLNNRTAFRQAVELATRLVREERDNPPAWVERGWRLALARAPAEAEKREALELMETLARNAPRPEDWSDLPAPLAEIPLPRAAALAKFCLAIFNLNEFASID